MARKVRKSLKFIRYDYYFLQDECPNILIPMFGVGLLTAPLTLAMTVIMLGPVLLFHITRFVYMFVIRFVCCCVC